MPTLHHRPRRPAKPRGKRLARAAVLCLFLWCLAPAAPSQDEPSLPAAVIHALKGHTETVYAVGFSPDGKYVLTASFDKTLKLWDAATGKEVKTFGGPQGHTNLIVAATFSPDGRTIATGATDNTAK